MIVGKKQIEEQIEKALKENEIKNARFKHPKEVRVDVDMKFKKFQEIDNFIKDDNFEKSIANKIQSKKQVDDSLFEYDAEKELKESEKLREKNEAEDEFAKEILHHYKYKTQTYAIPYKDMAAEFGKSKPIEEDETQAKTLSSQTFTPYVPPVTTVMNIVDSKNPPESKFERKL